MTPTTERAIEIINSCQNSYHTGISISYLGLLVKAAELSEEEKIKIWDALSNKIDQLKEQANAAR
jgi:hypothetical protein